jgi:hypothetical protein
MRVGFVVLVACLALGCRGASGASTADGADAGDGWTVIAAGTANLYAISGTSDTNVIAVGDQGTIAHWDGTKVNFEDAGTKATLRGVFVLDADHAFAVGDAGLVLERKAGAWKTVAAGVTLQTLNAVWADATRVVAAGTAGTVVLGTITGTGAAAKTQFAVVDNAQAENLLGVTGITGGPATIVGALGLVLELEGNNLSRLAIPSFSKLLAGAATAPGAGADGGKGGGMGAGAIYLVGQAGSVFRADARGLTPVTGCPPTFLRAVASAGTDAWIAGWDGIVCHVEGSKATSFAYGDPRWFNGIYAASPTSLWVCGATGTLLHGLPTRPSDGDAGAADASNDAPGAGGPKDAGGQ